MHDIYVVTARAKDRTGREDESTGAVPLGNLKGDALANALMKAETKAKRRVTLSIAGLGWLDETELETVKGVVTGAPDTPVATIHDAILDDGLADGAAHGDSARTPGERATTAAPQGPQRAKPPRQQPSAGPREGEIPEGVQAVIKSILARVVGLYPGEKSDPTVLEDRKNMLHAIFDREIDSGMAGVYQLADLGFDALREGLAKLDRVQREAPPPSSPAPSDERPVHPDITATATLLASLQARAGRAGVTPERWEQWLEDRQIPRTGDGEPILSAQERGLLSGAFNEALAALKQALAAPATKSTRRRALDLTIGGIRGK